MALKALDRRAWGRAELAAKLVTKGADPQIVEGVLDRLEEVGLINDADFAAQWVESRHRVRGLPANRLAVELRRKGLDEETIAQALAPIDRHAEATAAIELARSKARTLVGVERDKALRRLVGVLGRRGFSAELAWSTAKQALAELEGDSRLD